ncbi:DPB3 [Candida pseudojiufengensis]|uniref:DPB3 n=1 Tax=Candida pseudojiufengensis TaxID=497109 RepID=UPI002225131D|nr:DPB3 [Candida pseudojiufengensis]KAI5966245.1 DPB3 [Candida pseudojiufengensis]
MSMAGILRSESPVVADQEIQIEEESNTATPLPQEPEEIEIDQVTNIDQNKDETPIDEDLEEVATMSLPLSKIKKIFKMDMDYSGASSSAVYTTGLATELFVQYFVEQASLLAKMDKRKKIIYKDFANAVSSHDSLNFLSDTIPKTHQVGELISRKKISTLDQINLNANTVKRREYNNSNRINNSKDSNNGGNIQQVQKLRKQQELPKGQQTLNFQSEKPLKKASVTDLMTTEDDNDENVNEDADVEMIE